MAAPLWKIKTLLPFCLSISFNALPSQLTDNLGKGYENLEITLRKSMSLNYFASKYEKEL